MLAGKAPDPGEKVPQGHGRAPKATEHAAAAVKVNPRYVSDAKRIAEKAPEPMDAGQARGCICGGAGNGKRGALRPPSRPGLDGSEPGPTQKGL